MECAKKEGLRFYPPQHEQGMVHILVRSLNIAIDSQPLHARPPLGQLRSTWLQAQGPATVNRLPVLLLQTK